ncbi:MAG: exodeoxyribonuclease I [Gammaproteobacteria bacterium]|nr:exodeoxyribonuclease I [Gammaproteobacteria bacterium]
MAASFYWYDLETSGTNPRWDRVVQFAGIRTDMDLNPVGDECATYVELPDDVLPNPDATLVTGITPAQTRSEGVSEWRALHDIEQLFSQPGTCVAGYNSLRFDDEFIRYGFYRMLMDPYAREWQNGNSRWDIIDLVRATGALRREGINWPTDDDGLPVYRLELLTKANDLDHGNAHDALSDVHATVALARLIKHKQPKLFDYYYNGRSKKQVRQLLEPYGARVCLHVSGMYPRTRFGCAPVVSVCRHPKNSNSVIVADLSQDVEPLISWPEDRIRDSLFAKNPEVRPPLKEIRINRCPFVAGIEVMNDENWSRIGFDKREIKERQRRLARGDIARKLMRVYGERQHDASADVEAALYDAFLQDQDRERCVSFGREVEAGNWVDLDYVDGRLPPLAARLKARSFPGRLTTSEQADWHEFVRDKLSASDAPWLTLERFQSRIDELEEQVPDNQDKAERQARLLAALGEHAGELRQRYAP